MVGTDPTGKGGIASVVSVLVGEGFLRQHDVRYVSSHTASGRCAKLVAAIGSFLSVIWSCAFSRPSIVHVHSASRTSFLRKSLLLVVARAFGCKTIFHLHSGEFRQFATEESGGVMRWWIRRTLENSTKVIALSDSWARFLSGFAPSANVLVVPNSVKVYPLAVPSAEEPGRILFLGRAVRAKGIFELLAAVSLLKVSSSTVKLAVGGDGDLAAVKARVAELGIGDRVEILGWVGPEQKSEELARAAVFALPSYAEGLPMAMLEAMSAGKAIVVTPVGGIPEAITDGENGLLVSPGDTGAVARALKILLGNPALRRELGINARKTIEARFSTDVVIGKLSALYDELSGMTRK